MQREEQPTDSSLAVLLDTPYEGLYIIDGQWRYTYANSKAAQLVGRPIETLLGRNIWQLFPEAVETVIYTCAHRAVEQHVPLHFDTYYPPLKTWFESRLYPAPEGLVVLSQDITARKQVEQQHQRQAALLDLIAEPIIIWKFDGPILYWNSGAERLYGFRKAEALGRNTHDLLQTKHPEPLRRIYETLARTGKWEGELTHTAKDGRQIVVACIKALSTEEDGSQFIMEANRDFTQHKELEQRKDEFISMASHELKNPLTSLLGFTQLLRLQLVQQGRRESIPTLDRMQAQVARLTKLIDDFLDVSKIQAGRLDYQTEPVDLDALIRETVEELQASHPGHRLTITGATRAVIAGDKDRLGQVLINLLTNAIKYSLGASRVEVSLSSSNGNATISVRDYGVGIPQAHQQHVFERYYRVADTSGTNISGLGIGLYLAHEIIKRHGGDIVVESEVGKGSLFTVTLPLI
jgi:PAS domain S-box-containing protein